MITLHSDMILASVIFTSVFGVLSGGVYSLMRHLFWCACKMLTRILRAKKDSKKRYDVPLNFFDGCFVFAVGFVYMLSSYALVDGVLEIYSAVTLVIGIFVGKRALDGILFNVMKTEY